MRKRVTRPAKETNKGQSQRWPLLPARAHSLCPALPPDWLAAPCYLFGSNGLIVGAVLHNLTVGQLRVSLLLQCPRQPHPQLEGEATVSLVTDQGALNPLGDPYLCGHLTCGLMPCGMPASTRERSFSERGRETAILSQVRSPTSWLWVNSR